MAQDGYIPQTVYEGAPVPERVAEPLPPQPAIFQLRPLSLGEILDRTFTVYRSHFWLFAGLGCVAASLVTLLSAIQLVPLHLASHAGTPEAAADPFGVNSQLSPNVLAGLGLGMIVVMFVFLVVYTFVYVVTQAATVYAVQEVYLGRGTTIVDSVKATIGRWYRYLGIGIWQSFSAMWVAMVAIVLGLIIMGVGAPALGATIAIAGGIAGFIAGFIFYLRNSLGVQTAVVESLTVSAAMRRSKVLTNGAKGRIFVLLLLAVALNYAASLLRTPLLLFVMFSLAKGKEAIGAEIAMLIVSFVAQATVQPVAMIGLSLLYFDQRVRQEALDLLVMLGPEVPAYAAPVAVPLGAPLPPSPVVATEPLPSVSEPVAYAEAPLDPADPIGDDGRF